jgi:hypothetical protein
MLKVPLILRTLAFAHFGTSVANACTFSALRVYIASFWAITFQIDYGIETRTYDTIEFDREFMPSSEEVSRSYGTRKHHLRLFEKLFYFYHSLPRASYHDSFHRLQSGLDLAVPACVGALKPPPF